MNIEDYIASGILESYALGFTTDEENALLECLVKTNPRVAEELRSIQESLELVALENEMEPPSDLKAAIWAEIKQNDIQTEAKIVELKTAAPIEKESNETVINSNNQWLKIAAMLVLICSLGLVSIYYFNQSNSLKQNISNIEKAEQEKLAKLKEKDAYIAFLAQSSTKKVMLKGIPGKEGLEALVHWNANSKKVMLSELNLPKPSADKQYQLWALMDGKPIDAGMLNSTDNDALLEMKAIENSQAFAITLEPKGGSPSPHLEDLCVMGEIK